MVVQHAREVARDPAWAHWILAHAKKRRPKEIMSVSFVPCEDGSHVSLGHIRHVQRRDGGVLCTRTTSELPRAPHHPAPLRLDDALRAALPDDVRLIDTQTCWTRSATATPSPQQLPRQPSPTWTSRPSGKTRRPVRHVERLQDQALGGNAHLDEDAPLATIPIDGPVQGVLHVVAPQDAEVLVSYEHLTWWSLSNPTEALLVPLRASSADSLHPTPMGTSLRKTARSRTSAASPAPATPRWRPASSVCGAPQSPPARGPSVVGHAAAGRRVHHGPCSPQTPPT